MRHDERHSSPRRKVGSLGHRPFEIAEQRNPRITKFLPLGIKPEKPESLVYGAIVRLLEPFGPSGRI